MEYKVVLVTGEISSEQLSLMRNNFYKGNIKLIFWGTSVDKNLIADKSKVDDFFEIDITNISLVEKAGEELYRKYKRIDVLINNVSNHLMDESVQWQKTVDNNLTAIFNCIKVVAPYMIKQKFGKIINSASLVNVYQTTEQNSFDTTKSGLLGISRVWTRELSKHGITVNTVYIGFVEPETYAANDKLLLQNVCSKIPAGRLAKPIEIVKTYQFLISDEASYISGTSIFIDGGYFS
ncbi:MAG: SDR family oxidoreductase [Cytophagales bacterium]|nr:MAG: SDR family oxidoreductase [Cytophagales bacterium]